MNKFVCYHYNFKSNCNECRSNLGKEVKTMYMKAKVIDPKVIKIEDHSGPWVETFLISLTKNFNSPVEEQ